MSGTLRSLSCREDSGVARERPFRRSCQAGCRQSGPPSQGIFTLEFSFIEVNVEIQQIILPLFSYRMLHSLRILLVIFRQPGRRFGKRLFQPVWRLSAAFPKYGGIPGGPTRCRSYCLPTIAPSPRSVLQYWRKMRHRIYVIEHLAYVSPDFSFIHQWSLLLSAPGMLKPLSG